MIVSRRAFIATSLSTAGALVLSITLPERGARAVEPDSARPFSPNAWLSVAPDGTITLTLAKSEMGQGIWTALPMLIAEELEADWTRVQIRQADARPRDSYQNTGGSSSVVDSWEPLRRAGGVARVVLTNAAAEMWQVPANECQARNGTVVHQASGREASYGSLCERASTLPVPDLATVTLKSPGDFRLIGTPAARLDAPMKVTGQARYGIDVRVPGMLHASVERCPHFGGRLLRYDSAAALAVKGVKQVVALDPVGAPIHLPSRVAVVATSTWAALQGRRALRIEWDSGPHADLSSAHIARDFATKLGGPAKRVVDKNDPGAHFDRKPILDAVYEVPFLAHQAMEPINCTAHVTSDGIEIWAPTQYPTYAQRHVSRLTDLPLEQIRLHITLMGGGFGRRINADFIVEAVQVSKAAGAPVQVLWTREDDVRGDYYRPAGLQHVRAALVRNEADAAGGASLAWDHRIVGPSTNSFYTPGHARPEEQELWGATELPYRLNAHRLEYVEANTPVPIGWWRSVAHSQNVFAIECAINELADLARADHVAFRRELLSEHPRLQAVLELAALRAGWSKRTPKRHGRGVAACKYGDTYVAQVIEVSISARRITVERIVCAIDCGLVVNPSGLEAQVEGSIVWGLSAALTGEITIANGAVVQSNYHDAPVLRLSETPRIEVHVIRGSDRPSGAGEPAVAPVAPALVDAIRAATGRRVRRLPVMTKPAVRQS